MPLGPTPNSYTRDTTSNDLVIASELLKAQQYDTAQELILTYLDFHPHDEAAIYLLALLFEEQRRPGAAANILAGLVDTSERWEVHHRYGMVLDDLHLGEHAQAHYAKALELKPGNKDVLLSMATSGAMALDTDYCLHWAEQALLHGVEAERVRVQMAYAQLSLGNHEEGWPNYMHGIGRQKWRPDRRYGDDEQRWDGTPGARVMLHGEQGIGDQIAFLSCLAQAQASAHIVGLDLDAKIAPLVQRSFPDVSVTGDLADSVLSRQPEPFDCSQAISALPAFYRKSQADFPGTPYLVADPLRRAAYRGLLDSLPPGKNIGLAWSGGNRYTQRHARTAPLEAMLPMLNRPGFNWVSLEYKHDPVALDWLAEKGVNVHDVPYATRTNDYDDTAALIAELDAVVAVPTTAVHCAGALGVPTYCMVVPRPPIHYGGTGSRMCWYGSVELFRRADYSEEEWRRVVKEVNEKL